MIYPALKTSCFKFIRPNQFTNIRYASRVAPSISTPQFISKRCLSTSEYHELADEALETITESYERLVENKPEIDVDLSQGVLTLMVPPIGTYVLNKQPPNLQIWLSSPISGPKRFDWDEDDKKWISSRDQSTLGLLLKQETKESLDMDLDLELD